MKVGKRKKRRLHSQSILSIRHTLEIVLERGKKKLPQTRLSARVSRDSVSKFSQIIILLICLVVLASIALTGDTNFIINVTLVALRKTLCFNKKVAVQVNKESTLFPQDTQLPRPYRSPVLYQLRQPRGSMKHEAAHLTNCANLHVTPALLPA